MSAAPTPIPGTARAKASSTGVHDLPESTYYFILDPGKDKEVITGYIYLRR
jgi:hypothetical protein